ncbi:MAG: plasmid pRiA4b ORF-3 family protein [Oscillochloris sp.]|nr:plasmid pRiA4b ORF-3 family protein [Oscillochloris sp.]
MAKPKINFTELIHQTIRDAGRTLTIDEIAAQVLNLSGGESTKSLKNTIRNAITQSTAIIAPSEGNYGWKSHMLNGAVHRLILQDKDLTEHTLMIDDLQRDLLEPNGPGTYKYGVSGLPQLELASGPTIEVATIPRPFDDDMLNLPESFWEWLERQGAQPGDSLLLTAIDTDARRYSLSYEPAADRDNEAIAERSQLVVDAAVHYVHRTRGNVFIRDIAGYLNASGIFHQIPAPLPFTELWAPEVWGPLVDQYNVSPYLIGGYDEVSERILSSMLSDNLFPADALNEPSGTGEGPIISVGTHGSYQGELGVDPELLQARIDAFLASPDQLIPEDDPLLPAIITVFSVMALPSPTGKAYLASQLVELFGDSDEIVDWIEHGAKLGMVNIDPAYEVMFDQVSDFNIALPAPGPRSNESRTLVLRVAYRYKPEIWREIEIADDQYLSDLHLAIQRAFAWDNDHRYAFYTGKRPYDSKTEIGTPDSNAHRRADKVSIGEMELRTRQKFLYLFDFGDDHLFDIQVMKINPKAPPGTYPHVVGEHGGRLAQYKNGEGWDEENWDEDE